LHQEFFQPHRAFLPAQRPGRLEVFPGGGEITSAAQRLGKEKVSCRPARAEAETALEVEAGLRQVLLRECRAGATFVMGGDDERIGEVSPQGGKCRQT
jgi:hypothetical protein